jgi:hypothetical protein
MIKRSTLLKKMRKVDKIGQEYLNNRYAQYSSDTLEHTVMQTITDGQANYINSLINKLFKFKEKELEKLLTGE